jgi:hypothetical protein
MLVEFVHALLIACEPNVLLRNAVSEINPNHRMNARFLCGADKGKYGRTAVDVCQGERIQLFAFCLGNELVYGKSPVFKTEVGMAIEKHGKAVGFLPEKFPEMDLGKN